jgi:polysaccharide biosynthesis/export protein
LKAGISLPKREGDWLSMKKVTSKAAALFCLVAIGVSVSASSVAQSVAAPASTSAPASTPAPTPVPVSVAPVAPLPRATHPAYRINPGDEIEVYVWGEDRLQRSSRVLPDGSFSFPLVGKIDAAGRLPTELESIISVGLKDQYRGPVPQVTVSVRSPSGLQFSVIGRVRTPGIFTPGRNVNLLEALSFAGGTDEFAKVDGIVVIRKSGSGIQTIRAQLGAALKGNIPSGEAGQRLIPLIESGDTIIVP